MRPKRTLSDRFWTKVDRNGPVPEHRPEIGPCWLWTAFLDPWGRGYLRTRRGDGTHNRTAAARISWAIHYGMVPEGLWVLHRCDNPSCVCPDHLFLGTCADNHADMVSKGRSTLGAKNPRARLTDEVVREIRRLHKAGAVQRHLAKEFGLSPANVCLIVNRQAWTHLE